MNILIILSLYIFCHITHPKVYWVRKQCFTISHGSVVGLAYVGVSHLEVFVWLQPSGSWG